MLDADYRGFLDLVAEHIATSLADARAYEEERRRAEALAEIDRAKTAFFSNVSHEFRTPLTLMLGPLEELLAKPEGELARRRPVAGGDGPPQRPAPAQARQHAARLLAHRGGPRRGVLRADRPCQAHGGAGVQLPLGLRARRACGSMSTASRCREPVYVDRDMWEKIVLNLLSNAFKFTFEGEIAVRLARDWRQVPSSGSATPASASPSTELPRLFERFHRIEGQRGRSFEGSGIGLALVQELVRLHGGTIAVESEVGRGTTFTVALPFGTAHLPAERIGGRAQPASPPRRAPAAYVEEALRWLPDERHRGEESPAAERRGAELARAGASPRGSCWRTTTPTCGTTLAACCSRRGWEVEAVADGRGGARGRAAPQARPRALPT